MRITTIDLNFLGLKGEIATYLVPHSGGVVLVDPGPESTIPTLIAGMNLLGVTEKDVTHVLLTHIHFDHAGAAGWFAQKGAQIFVHPIGAPHLLNPERLVASASRLYGTKMDRLWGEMKPVRPENLTEVKDGLEIFAGDLRIIALHTPGHAEHHISYIYNDVIFSGDVGGLRFGHHTYVRLPFVPPETNLEKWRASLGKMKEAGCGYIAPTHFGIFNDAREHIDVAERYLSDMETWLEKNMPGIQDVDTLGLRFHEFQREHCKAAGLDNGAQAMYERGGPASFAASGLFRYWKKVRNRT